MSRRFQWLLRWSTGRHRLWTLSWIVVLGGLVASESVAFIPRYLVALLPLVYVILALVLSNHGRRKELAVGVFSLICVANVLNAHGNLYPRLTDVHGIELARTGGLLDRSREVVDDHRSNLDAMQALAAHTENPTIIAPRPYLDMLAIPRLGYAQFPATIYGVNLYSDAFRKIHDITTLLDNPPLHPTFIVVGNSWLRLSGLFDSPRPQEIDHVIYDDHQTSPLVIFEKRWPQGEPTRRELQDWYLKRLWPNAKDVDRRKFSISFFRERGDTARAVTEALAALAVDPRDFHLRQLTAAALFEADRVEEGVECCLGFLEWDRERRSRDFDPVVMARYGLDIEPVVPPGLVSHEPPTNRSFRDGMLALQDGRLIDASRHFEAGFNEDPTHIDVAFCLGMIYQYQSRLTKADECFRAVLQFHPDFAPAQKRLAQIALARSETTVAIESAKGMTRIASNGASVHTARGSLLAPFARERIAPREAQRGMGLSAAARGAKQRQIVSVDLLEFPLADISNHSAFTEESHCTHGQFHFE